jgi:hypothetical protein
MAQDIRKLLKEHSPKGEKLSEGHEARFRSKLERSFARKEKSFPWLKVASVIAVMIAVAWLGYNSLSEKTTETIADTTEQESVINTPQLTLADISPDLKKVEDYYMTGINVQLASLQINKDNKELIDGYMKQLSELDKEYQELNKELSAVGPTEETINALIDNLKIRLELLFKLKNKLNELKNKNNEDYNII